VEVLLAGCFAAGRRHRFGAEGVVTSPPNTDDSSRRTIK